MILAFDCATCTGWCAGDGASVPIVGTVTMPRGVEPGPFLTFWRRWVLAHLSDIKPTVVVFEAPILPRETNVATVRKLVGLAGTLEQVCDELKIPVFETTTSHVKKVLTGSGSAQKPDMMRVARKCGVEAKTFDEADAFGVWIAAVHHHARQYQASWDAKLYSGRGLV
jgi:Holliday junction resolvasome RuvABC endonuclease subunit